MLFNSFEFLIAFLPTTLLGFFFIGAWHRRAAAAWLVLASFVFYGWWDFRFVVLLACSIAWNSAAGLLLLGRPRSRRLTLIVAIAGNLALLGYFKYAGLFVRTLDGTLGTTFGPLDIVLPVGISFFTFTQIAYLVDASRGEVRRFNFVHYALFVSYFPHLIAGPILHHREMLPQFARPATYRIQADLVAVGIVYFTIGLAKKCLIADGFSVDVAAAFDAAASGGALSAPVAWRGALAYALQIYFDFSGYIDMAIGVSLLFGIRLPLNFNSPYKSTSIIEFWRRWHMTLSRFLRNYLYIPLGGNRKGDARRYVNLMVTMLLGGLWHGANWTFVVWGGLHGVYLIVNRVWRQLKPQPAIERLPPMLRKWTAIIVTFLCVLVSWVLFRAADIPSALRMLHAMAGADGFAAPPQPAVYGEFDLLLLGLGAPTQFLWLTSAALYLGGLFIVFALPNSQEIVEPDRYANTAAGPVRTMLLHWAPSRTWAVLCALAFFVSLMTFTRVSEFLYYQF